VNTVSMRYNRATLSLGNVSTWTWCSRLGAECKADDCAVKETLVAKSKDVKPGCYPVRSSKEGHGSKGDILSVITKMMITVIALIS
jgi:hypothetical protein